MTDFQEEVKKLILEGYSVTETSKLLKKPSSSVSSVVKTLKLTPKRLKVNSVNHEYFNKIDEERKAYFLGFLLADGNICDNRNSKDRSFGRISINIQEEDGYILSAFREAINAPNELTRRNYQAGAQSRKPQISLRWTSKPMTEVLGEIYGIHGDKTHDSDFKFDFSLIDKTLIGHFLRGFIDGDGCFESNKGTFTITIVGTSKNWLTQIGELVSENTGLSFRLYEKSGKTCKYFYLRFSANNKNKVEKITKFYSFIYGGSTIYLKRKRDRIESYLEYRANQIRVKGIWQCRA